VVAGRAGEVVAWRGWLAFVALGIIWGLPYFFIRIALQEVPPLALAFSRAARHSGAAAHRVAAM